MRHLERVGSCMGDGRRDSNTSDKHDCSSEHIAPGWIKHSGQPFLGHGEGISAKNYPSDNGEQEHGATPEELGQSVPGFFEAFVKDQQRAVISAPYQKSPVRAVPD